MNIPNESRTQSRGPRPRKRAGRASFTPRSAQLRLIKEDSTSGYLYSFHDNETPLLPENGMRVEQRSPESAHPGVNHEEDRCLLLAGPATGQGEQDAFKQVSSPSHYTKWDGESDSRGKLQDEERLIQTDILPLAAFSRSPIPAFPALIEFAQRSSSPSISNRTWEPMTRFQVIHSPHCLCTSCWYNRVTQISSTSEPYQPSLLSRPEDYWIEIDEFSRYLGDAASPALFHPDGWRGSYEFSTQFRLRNERPSMIDDKNVRIVFFNFVLGICCFQLTNVESYSIPFVARTTC
jgi:hypothetical protein